MAKPANEAQDVTAQLRRAVSIAAIANRVMAIASTFRLTTLNAAILTTRAGESARGFAQVAEELRRFSDNVDVAMKALTHTALAPVATVSAVLKYARLAQIMKRVAKTDASRASLQAAAQRIDSTIAANMAALGTLTGQLGAELDRVVRINRLGRGLARLAKIEAAHCSEHSTELLQVAEEFERSIAQMAELLQSAESEAQEGRA